MSIAQFDSPTIEATVHLPAPSPEQVAHGPTLKELDPLLAGYRKPSAWISVWQLTSTVALFIAGWTLMYWSLSISYALTLALSVPTSLLVARIFIIQHDCGHRSFFRSKKMNDLVGHLLAVVTFTPYHAWRREHAIHHASSGDLDRRGKSGEIWTMTVREYQQASWLKRTWYRIFRSPIILFGIGPFIQFAIRQRFAFELPRTWKRERRGIYLTNAMIYATAAALCWFVGTWEFFAIEIPIMVIASSTGVWLFYVQHQYEEAFWESHEDWDYVQAALAGSSHYRLPKILQWFTGNIGLHHIHHLDSRIPNYHLQACHDDNPELQDVVELTLWESLACANMKLWDEERGKMVSFSAAARS